MTTKRAMPKPVKMWAVEHVGRGYESLHPTSRLADEHAKLCSWPTEVVPVLVTPIEPKKRRKK